MRKFLAFLAILAALALGQAHNAAAQALVQQSPTHVDAGNLTAVGTNWNTVNTQSTATATAPGGQYVYVTALYMGACQDGTGVAAANLNFTTTNLGGAEFAYSTALSANACPNEPGLVNFPVPLKAAQAGTAVTLVSPAAQSHIGFATEIFYYTAP